MKTKLVHINWIPFGMSIVSLLAIYLGYILMHEPSILWLCEAGKENCLSEYLILGVGKALYYKIDILPFVFLIISFVPKKVAQVWLWFAIPYLVFVVWFLSGTKAISGAIIPIDFVDWAQIFSYLFAALSAVVVLITYIVLWYVGKKKSLTTNH